MDKDLHAKTSDQCFLFSSLTLLNYDYFTSYAGHEQRSERGSSLSSVEIDAEARKFYRRVGHLT